MNKRRVSFLFTASITVATATIVATQACVSRPDGWSNASHASDTAAYDVVFAPDTVHEITLEIAPSDLQSARDDLRSILATSQGPGTFPMGDGGMGFPPFGDGGFPMPPFGDGGFPMPPFGDGGFPMPPFGDGGMAGPPGAPAGGATSLLSRDPAYVPVTVRFQNRAWPYVGMRFKGNSSLATLGAQGNRKLPFRLDFDRYEDQHPETQNQRFYGFREMTFSANFADDSQVREAFVLDSLRAAGVPAPRYAFARVTVRSGSNVEYWGLYTMIEDPSDRAMRDRVLSSHSGNVYKPSGTTANWTSFAAADFEKKTNETEADFSDVQAAIAALNDRTTDRAAWRRNLEARFDVDGFLAWLAVNTVAANWDAYGQMPHNYFLYGDPAQQGRLRWIPWDHNLSMGTSFGPRSAATTNAQEFLHTSVTAQWPLIRTLLDDATYASAYRAHVTRALDGPFAPATAAARLDALHALVAPHVVGERGEQEGSRTISSPAAFEASVRGSSGLVSWVEQRVTRARAALSE
ncbi:MAG: CotH kinase family protein [Myxococcales bacterium]|nr:CotH kinase family protein [Myxococcales bacterium]